MDGIMGISFPWARNSIVRWLVSREPQTNAWAIERLAEKYGVRLWFFGPRVYVSYGGMEVSRVIPTLVLGSVGDLLQWTESYLKVICDDE